MVVYIGDGALERTPCNNWNIRMLSIPAHFYPLQHPLLIWYNAQLDIYYHIESPEAAKAWHSKVFRHDEATGALTNYDMYGAYALNYQIPLPRFIVCR